MNFRKIINILFFLLFFNVGNLFPQWITEDQFSRVSLDHVSIVDTSTVWVVGYSGFPPDTPFIGIRKPGIWQKLYYWNMDLPLGVWYNCIKGLSDSIALVGNYNGQVFLTSNAGTNWVLKIDAGQSSFINDIRFSRQNKNIGFVFCDPPSGPGGNFEIYKTTDGGFNWSLSTPNFGSGLVGAEYSSCVTDSNHAWYGLYCYNYSQCTSGIKIAYTSDGGFNWMTTPAIAPNSESFTSLCFRDDNTFGLSSFYFWGAQDNTNIYSSTNSGNSWTLLQNLYQSGYPVWAINWIPDTKIWYFICGPSNPIINYVFKTKNDGSNWYTMSRDNEDGQLTYLDAVRYNDKIYAWASSYGGRIFRLIDTAEIIGIKRNDENTPTSFSLLQNFPNPFNPVTTIKYDLPKDSKVTIKVYDLLGKEVATLVNENKQAGYYETVFNGSNLASGVYFYRIEAGSFTAVKKMVLVK